MQMAPHQHQYGSQLAADRTRFTLEDRLEAMGVLGYVSAGHGLASSLTNAATDH